VDDSSTFQVNREAMEKAIRSTKPSAIKAVSVEVPQVHWSAIGGMEDVKRQLREAIEFPLTHGHMFQQLGIRPPRGVLLYGPPGCSKTLMARALATEGHMNFLAVKGPELLSKWLGESERALASLFRRARLASPAVIFFDEIDAIASKRGGRSSGGERLLSQLLTELDGIQSKEDSPKKGRVVVVCATNRPDLLDSALMRPGRIDRMIYVGIPDVTSRCRILQISLQAKSCADGIDVSSRAFSGVV
jgi:SpoVK/Ycf46/Vps4 family AAA+-type ATPase